MQARIMLFRQFYRHETRFETRRYTSYFRVTFYRNIVAVFFFVDFQVIADRLFRSQTSAVIRFSFNGISFLKSASSSSVEMCRICRRVLCFSASFTAMKLDLKHAATLLISG